MLTLAFEIADPMISIFAVQVCKVSIRKARQMRSRRLIQYGSHSHATDTQPTDQGPLSGIIQAKDALIGEFP